MKMIYGVKDKPKFPSILVFAFQQLLAIMAATIAVPMIVNAASGSHMSTSAALFGAGVGTLVYVAFTKAKSPVFLGSSFAFLGSMAAAFGGGKESDIGAGIFIFLLRDGLFAACEETLEGFEDYLFVEVVEIAFGCFGKAHAHSPAQGVALAVEGGTLGIALAREDAEGCRGYCKE